MGGRIGVKSRVDQGTQIYFSIGLEEGVPVPMSPSADLSCLNGLEADSPPAVLPPLKILLAEDYQPNAEIVLVISQKYTG